MQMIQENIIHAISVDDKGNAYAATQSGLLKIADDGTTSQTDITTPVTTLLHVSGTMLAGGIGMIRLSKDGTSWDVYAVGILSTVMTDIVASKNGFLAGTLEDGVLVSEDGSDWRGYNFGLLDWQVLSLTVSPDGTAFAGTESGLFKSINGGHTWETLAAPVDSPVLSLAYHDSTLFAGTESGALLQSPDDGKTWAILKQNGEAINAIAINNSGEIAVLQGDTVSISNDGGQTCNQVKCSISQISTLEWRRKNQLLIGTSQGNIVPIDIAEPKE